MKMCPWEKIDNFRSPSEFKRFTQWLDERIRDGEAKEVSVQSPYAGATSLQEKWVVHVESGDIWRLVWPDPPFVGVFEPVKLSQEAST